MTQADDSRFAALMGLKKYIDEQLEVERAKQDAALIARYLEDGTRTRDVRVSERGAAVGTISIRRKDRHTERASYPEDMHATARWFTTDGNGYDIMLDMLYSPTMRPRVMRFFTDYTLLTGVVPDGVKFEDVDTPESVTTQTRGFKPDDVLAAFGALPEAVARVLAPANDESE